MLFMPVCHPCYEIGSFVTSGPGEGDDRYSRSCAQAIVESADNGRRG